MSRLGSFIFARDLFVKYGLLRCRFCQLLLDLLGLASIGKQELLVVLSANSCCVVALSKLLRVRLLNLQCGSYLVLKGPGWLRGLNRGNRHSLTRCLAFGVQVFMFVNHNLRLDFITFCFLV